MAGTREGKRGCSSLCGAPRGGGRAEAETHASRVCSSSSNPCTGIKATKCTRHPPSLRSPILCPLAPPSPLSLGGPKTQLTPPLAPRGVEVDTCTRIQRSTRASARSKGNVPTLLLWMLSLPVQKWVLSHSPSDERCRGGVDANKSMTRLGQTGSA